MINLCSMSLIVWIWLLSVFFFFVSDFRNFGLIRHTLLFFHKKVEFSSVTTIAAVTVTTSFERSCVVCWFSVLLRIFIWELSSPLVSMVGRWMSSIINCLLPRLICRQSILHIYWLPYLCMRCLQELIWSYEWSWLQVLECGIWWEWDPLSFRSPLLGYFVS